MRAVAGLPLGDTTCDRPTAMLNIISLHPKTEDILQIKDVHLHLYGKDEREGRKLGHITLTANNHHELAAGITQVADLLPNPMAIFPGK